MFGWKARVGAVVPAVNTTLEGEARIALPEGVSWHAGRFVSVAGDGSKAYAAQGLSPVMRVALQNCLAVQPDIVVLGCTTATFLHGVAYDESLTAAMSKELRLPFFTAAGSALAALMRLGVKRPALISPYDSATDDRVVRFLGEAGLAVGVRGGPDGISSIAKGQLPMWAPIAAAREMDLSGSDGIFLSCTNWRTLECIPALEDLYQVPVVSSNQAIFWRITKELDIARDGRALGSLFDLNPI